jgi:hypothetical protein
MPDRLLDIYNTLEEMQADGVGGGGGTTDVSALATEVTLASVVTNTAATTVAVGTLETNVITASGVQTLSLNSATSAQTTALTTALSTQTTAIGVQTTGQTTTLSTALESQTDRLASQTTAQTSALTTAISGQTIALGVDIDATTTAVQAGNTVLGTLNTSTLPAITAAVNALKVSVDADALVQLTTLTELQEIRQSTSLSQGSSDTTVAELTAINTTAFPALQTAVESVNTSTLAVGATLDSELPQVNTLLSAIKTSTDNMNDFALPEANQYLSNIDGDVMLTTKAVENQSGAKCLYMETVNPAVAPWNYTLISQWETYLGLYQGAVLTIHKDLNWVKLIIIGEHKLQGFSEVTDTGLKKFVDLEGIFHSASGNVFRILRPDLEVIIPHMKFIEGDCFSWGISATTWGVDPVPYLDIGDLRTAWNFFVGAPLGSALRIRRNYFLSNTDPAFSSAVIDLDAFVIPTDTSDYTAYYQQGSYTTLNLMKMKTDDIYNRLGALTTTNSELSTVNTKLAADALVQTQILNRVENVPDAWNALNNLEILVVPAVTTAVNSVATLLTAQNTTSLPNLQIAVENVQAATNDVVTAVNENYIELQGINTVSSGSKMVLDSVLLELEAINTKTNPDLALTSVTNSSVSSSITSVILALANPTRRSFSLFNNSTSILYLTFDVTASQATATVPVAPGGYYEMPKPLYLGDISGIWASANGNASICQGV